MEVEQFEALDKDILTRAIAEVVMGWSLCVDSSDGYHYRSWYNNARVFQLHEEDFYPLDSIDFAVKAVERLETNDRIITYQPNLMRVLYQDVDEVLVGSKMMDWIINATASQRMHALVLTVPEVMVRYEELKGQTE